MIWLLWAAIALLLFGGLMLLLNPEEDSEDD